MKYNLIFIINKIDLRVHQIPALDEIPLYMYNYYSNNYYSIFMNSEEKK